MNSRRFQQGRNGRKVNMSKLEIVLEGRRGTKSPEIVYIGIEKSVLLLIPSREFLALGYPNGSSSSPFRNSLGYIGADWGWDDYNIPLLSEPEAKNYSWCKITMTGGGSYLPELHRWKTEAEKKINTYLENICVFPARRL